MQRIEWTESLNLGIKSIDDQHRELVAMLNGLLDSIESTGQACPAENLVEKLKTYAAEHFHVEEGYMQAFAYPEFAEHQREHEDFLEKVARFESDCAAGKTSLADVLDFLQGWLTAHIVGTDRRMGSYLEDYLR